MGESRFTETAKFIARQLKMQFLHFLGAGAFKETFLVNNDKGMPFALKLVDPDMFVPAPEFLDVAAFNRQQH
ncbi:MAG TPA: hypothetical protein PKI71_16495 [Candidatus Rifleibacterium sp.]|nr:hypothetical protein [Candidatus Rifleibacterium sp.]